MGPRYSSDGAVQYVIRAGVNKIVFDQSNVPGTEYIVGGPTAVAKAAKVPLVGFTDTVPIQDANSVALKLVQAAGPNGGVVLNFTPDQALLILQAVQKQDLTSKVKAWGCSTPCNSDFVAAALGTAWDGMFGVNAELNLPAPPGRTASSTGSSRRRPSSRSGSGASARWASSRRGSPLRRS